MLLQTAQYVLVFKGYGFKFVSIDGHEFSREVHTLPTRVNFSVLDEIWAAEVERPVFLSFADYIAFKVGAIDGLETFCKGVEPDVRVVIVPHRTCHIVFEIAAQFAYFSKLAASVRQYFHIGKHKPLFVSFIAFSFH